MTTKEQFEAAISVLKNAGLTSFDFTSEKAFITTVALVQALIERTLDLPE